MVMTPSAPTTFGGIAAGHSLISLSDAELNTALAALAAEKARRAAMPPAPPNSCGATVGTEADTWDELTAMEKLSSNTEKATEEFRNYKDSDRQAVVENHYRLMREFCDDPKGFVEAAISE